MRDLGIDRRVVSPDEVVALGGADWDGEPFDHVLDTVGGAAVARLCRHLKPGGLLLTAATTPIPDKGLSATPAFFAVTPSGSDAARIAAAVSARAIDVPIAQILPLDQAAEAQRLVDAGGQGGKIILAP